LIVEKLAGQEQVARQKLNDGKVADEIVRLSKGLDLAKTLSEVRLIESQAGLAYWSAWRSLKITFAKQDISRIPEHWGRFDARSSPLTGSSRLAANPVNAVLNYLYALLEAEARLAALAIGLDPTLGVLHMDTDARDSLACDLMEPVRPIVDAYVLDWLARGPLTRNWFFEQPNGNCRLMSSLATQLAETTGMWRQAVAPFAEWVVHALWASIGKRGLPNTPATPLTQRHKREAKGHIVPTVKPLPVTESICPVCGVAIPKGKPRCTACTRTFQREHMEKIPPSGRVATIEPKAQAKRSATQRRQNAEVHAWNSSLQPSWLTEEVYVTKIKPRLAGVSVSSIASDLKVSRPYASEIRRGIRHPHPRHWLALAQLVGVSGD
jgi:hypothetical protein